MARFNSRRPPGYIISSNALEEIEVCGGAGAFDGAEAGCGAVEEIEEGGFLGGVDVGEDEPGAAAAAEGEQFVLAFREEFGAAPGELDGGGGGGDFAALEAGVGDILEEGGGGDGGEEAEGGGVEAEAGAVEFEGGFGPEVGVEGVAGLEFLLQVGEEGGGFLEAEGMAEVVEALVEGVGEELCEEEGLDGGGEARGGGAGGGAEEEGIPAGGDGEA